MKVLIILVVVVVLLVGVAIWGGQRDRNAPDPKPESLQGPVTRLLDRVLGGRFKDTFYVDRLHGCNRSGRTMSWAGECSVTIAAGDYKSSSFKLRPSGGIVQACFGFEPKQMKECIEDADKRGRVKDDGKSTFGVSKDSAFLRLYCLAGAGLCAVTIPAK